MSIATEAASPPAPPSDVPFDLTVGLYSRMVESGLIPQDRRVYLHDGRLYEKMAKARAHGYVGAALTMALVPRLSPGWGLWPESTIVLDPTNAPLPDFAVIGGASPLDFATADRYPGPADIGLLIEIAVTSLRAAKRGQNDLLTGLQAPGTISWGSRLEQGAVRIPVRSASCWRGTDRHVDRDRSGLPAGPGG
jgi:hypothetical protein